MKREAFVRELPDVDVRVINGLRISCCTDMTLPVELYAGDDIVANGAVTLPQSQTFMYGVAVCLFLRTLESRGIHVEWDGFRVDTMPSVRPAAEYTQSEDGLCASLQSYPALMLEDGWKMTQGLLANVPDMEKSPSAIMALAFEPATVGLINQYARVEIWNAPRAALGWRQKIQTAMRRIPRIF